MEQQPRVGVGVVLLHNGKLLLGKRKGAHGAGKWSFPGGKLEWWESVNACAIRETLEETGLIISDDDIDDSHFFVTEDRLEGQHYITIYVYANVRSIDGKLELREPEKCDGWEWFPPNSLPDPLWEPLKEFFEDERVVKRIESDIWWNHIDELRK
jgi:8-oxo-dGTP diphosphatase